jgi:group I intron endonuclease
MVIYLITNKVNGKKYVGQHCGTKDSRWKQHLAAALKLEDPKPLYAAMRKYGVENFTYEVLEVLGKNANEELLDEREKHFIKEYNTFIGNGQGYNLTLGGDGQIGTFCRQQTKDKMSDKMDKKNYAVYNPEDGKLIEIIDKLKDAAKKYGIRNSGWIPTTAKSNNLHSGKYKVLQGYVWLSAPNGESFPKSILPVGKKFVKKNLGEKPKRATEIAQYALSGLLVDIWADNPRDISNSLSLPYKSLLDALKDERKITGGYFWRRFPIGSSPDEIEEKMEKHVITFSKRQLTSFPIVKIVQGREVKRYASVIDAVIDSNLAPTKILDSLEMGKEDDSGNSWKWVQRPNYIRHTIKEYFRTKSGKVFGPISTKFEVVHH